MLREYTGSSGVWWNLVLIGRMQVWRLSNYDMYMFTGTREHPREILMYANSHHMLMVHCIQ